jgi:hypothetical protein
MENSRDAWPRHCRRFIVNALIGASTVALMLAAIGATADVYVYMLLIPCATVLAGIGLMLEPNIMARSASDIGPQPRTESNPPAVRA